MSQSFHNGKVVLHAGDCMEVLRELSANSIDAVCTDPPYHLTSIVKRFGGPNAAPVNNRDEKNGRNGPYHRAARGFMGKVWDGGDIAFTPELWAEVLRVLKPGGHMTAFSGCRTYHKMTAAIDEAGFEIRDMLSWNFGSGFPKSHSMRDIGRPDLGTALKPAHEPICLARKPLSEGTVAANVLRWGTGAINVDACRVGCESIVTHKTAMLSHGGTKVHTGRFPANLVHDGSPEVLAGFPETANGYRANDSKTSNAFFGSARYAVGERGHDDTGSAARFFYTAKADAEDRIGSKHPTVKPVDLMQWLVRLICPKGGTVLDPFAGTGTTGAAAFIEGCRAVLIEREAEYLTDIDRRMELLLSGPDERARKLAKPDPHESLPLFGVA